MYVQTLRHVYFSIIEDYLYAVKIFLGVTGTSILDLCTEFGTYIYHLLLLFSLNIEDI